MKIFETERLIIRSLKKADKKYFAELFTDPRVLELIPQKAFTENQITERFDKSLNLNLNSNVLWKKGKQSMMK
jgi:ribosomal-protein-alanine N-acetyltransferase